MKKQLVTLAVATALAAPTAAMAEAILYGKLHVSIDYATVKNVEYFDALDINGNPLVDEDGNALSRGVDYEGWGVNGKGYIPGEARANRIGVKGSEDLGGGLKAIYQVEFGINLADTNSNVVSGADSITYRNTFVGLAGNWGTFLVGRHDTPLKISTGKLDLFADTMADYNGTIGFQDLRADNAIAYISPSLGGFQLAAAIVAPAGANEGNVFADSINEAYSVAGIYSNGPFYAGVAYESLGRAHFMDTETQINGPCPLGIAADPTCEFIGDDFTKWRVGLGLLDWNGFTLTGIYEEQSDIIAGQAYYYNAVTDTYQAFGPEKQKLWQVQAGYSFGNNMIKAMYGSVDRDGRLDVTGVTDLNSLEDIEDFVEGDRSAWAVAFDHNFSKRTKAYVLYTEVDDDATADFILTGTRAPTMQSWTGFSLGLVHDF